MTVELYCGDCLEIMRTLPTGSVDAVITDPPYGLGKAEWDNNIWGLLKEAANECSRILKPTGVCFWFSSTRYLPETIEATSSIPYRWQFVWYASNNMQHGDLGFMKYTPCLVLSHGKAWRNMQDLRNVPIPPKQIRDIGHPTQKPIDLIRYLVEKGAKPDATVLDPFMGSGTAGVACVQTGRNFIGCEIDPGYFQIASRRIVLAQAQPALLQV
jgi:site-specific DNA-methyltransferase (adenine-specific)